MANAGTTANQPRQRVVLTLTSLYYLMMAMLGATIGAIAGLSNTSVTNTLMELIASVVAGSAGLYFLNRKALRQEADALWRIGLLGVLFIATFWIAYVVAADYRYSGPAYYKWQASAPLYRNVALAEIYGHARKLGIADTDLATALAVAVPPSGAAQVCDPLREDPSVVSSLGRTAYKGVANQSDDPELSPLAKYISARFNAIGHPLTGGHPDAATAAARLRDQAVVTLLLLIRQHRILAEPARLACGSNLDTNTCLDATRFQGMLATCMNDVDLFDLLVTMRMHAREFQAIWGVEVSTQPAKARYTFETSRRDPR